MRKRKLLKYKRFMVELDHSWYNSLKILCQHFTEIRGKKTTVPDTIRYALLKTYFTHPDRQSLLNPCTIKSFKPSKVKLYLEPIKRPKIKKVKRPSLKKPKAPRLSSDVYQGSTFQRRIDRIILQNKLDLEYIEERKRLKLHIHDSGKFKHHKKRVRNTPRTNEIAPQATINAHPIPNTPNL